ncbi:MAG: hypothetical protein OEM00_09355 [Burkholderiaceae bacterium]|nr:hypothetical protein [Burkholderiaceae bacterium]
MQKPQPISIDVLNNLDLHLAVDLITLLQAISQALEQHYAGALVSEQHRDWESRQSSLWPDDDPPF